MFKQETYVQLLLMRKSLSIAEETRETMTKDDLGLLIAFLESRIARIKETELIPNDT